MIFFLNGPSDLAVCQYQSLQWLPVALWMGHVLPIVAWKAFHTLHITCFLSLLPPWASPHLPDPGTLGFFQDI